MRKHLSIDYFAIGQRLRAYRIGASLKAEDVAKCLGISRAAIYRLEKGEIVKIEVLERLSRLLNVPISSLLGIDVEYYPNASGFFERMRQLEQQATQIAAHFEPFSILLTSPKYIDHLQMMLAESSFDQPSVDHLQPLQQVIDILSERKKRFSLNAPQIFSLVGVQQIEKFLYLGLIGTLNIPPSKKMERILSARQEVFYLIEQLEEQDRFVQIALVDESLPTLTFEVFYHNNTAFSLAISPFRLGEFPNINTGIASVTSAPEAIRLHQQMFERLWERGAKGSQAIDQLRKIIARY